MPTSDLLPFSAAEGYELGDAYDEAFSPGDDAPRPHPRPQYRQIFSALAGRDLDHEVVGVREALDGSGCRFGCGDQAAPFRVDIVPRVLTADEWGPLAAGLEQRVRALEAFLDDVHADRRICAEGVLPPRVVDQAEYFEPELRELPAGRMRIGLAGLDIVRTQAGDLEVLEDNLRTPSGLAYLLAARRAVGERLQPDASPVGVEEPIRQLLARVLDNATPVAEPYVVVLSDGPSNTAFWEHEELAGLLDVPLVTLDDLEPVDGGRRLCHAGRTVDVVYRRTNADRLRDPATNELTDVGAKLLDALRAGSIVCVNALGNGVADDKLVHAYVEDMVRFYLSEEPLVRSVPTLDPGRPECLAEVLDRLDALVIKPRAAYGGEGVFVGPHANQQDRDAMAQRLRADPTSYVAQETVLLSRHPTVIDGRLVPRHVDLRAFITFDGERAEAVPGGLSRVAFKENDLVVNSSKGGGAKDTWVMRS